MDFKNIVIGVVVVLLAGFAGGYAIFGHQSVQEPVATATGDTYITPTSVSIQGDFTGATYGYISGDNKYQVAALTNSSGRDRFIDSLIYGAIGLTTVSTSTTSNIGLTVATTSTITSGFNGNSNYVANGATIATSSSWYFQPATSTPTGSVASFATGVSRIWPTGTSLVFESPATSSASIWVRVNYTAQ